MNIELVMIGTSLKILNQTLIKHQKSATHMFSEQKILLFANFRGVCHIPVNCDWKYLWNIKTILNFDIFSLTKEQFYCFHHQLTWIWILEIQVKIPWIQCKLSIKFWSGARLIQNCRHSTINQQFWVDVMMISLSIMY